MGLNDTPAATRWQGEPPFGDPPRDLATRSRARTARTGEPKRRQRAGSDRSLVASVETSLARGHWRVALRRFAMLNASGQPIPSELSARCKALASLMTRRELSQVITDALDWAAFAEMGQAAATLSKVKK